MALSSFPGRALCGLGPASGRIVSAIQVRAEGSLIQAQVLREAWRWCVLEILVGRMSTLTGLIISCPEALVVPK